ncbi:MAG: dienelactone hydrolase family protein [Planctomycetes bacterium]|nr:dienelactone hydrolase family protein [Planctomycetota bacterium]
MARRLEAGDAAGNWVPTRRDCLAALAGTIAGAGGATAIAPRAARGDEADLLATVQVPPARVSADTLPSLVTRPGAPPITDWPAWLVARQRLRAEWLGLLGPWHVDPVDDSFTVLREEAAEGHVRRLVSYRSEPDETVEAWLLEPDSPPRGPLPAVAVFHPTVAESIDEVAGIAGRPERSTGVDLVRRGFVVLAPRCCLWNTSPDHRLDTAGSVARLAARHPGATGMRKMLHDASRCIDILTAVPRVDRTRLGAFGHSLGAKEVLYLAAFDERVRATVFSEGGIGIGFSNWHDPWYLGAQAKAPGFGHDHHELLALVVPRALVILAGEAGPGAADGDRSWPYVARALEVARLGREPPRLGLFNHRQGHALPPEALGLAARWLETFLAAA